MMKTDVRHYRVPSIPYYLLAAIQQHHELSKPTGNTTPLTPPKNRTSYADDFTCLGASACSSRYIVAMCDYCYDSCSTTQIYLTRS